MNTMGMKQKLKTMYPKSENWARKVVDTWTLISDPNIEPFKCDLFLPGIEIDTEIRNPRLFNLGKTIQKFLSGVDTVFFRKVKKIYHTICSDCLKKMIQRKEIKMKNSKINTIFMNELNYVKEESCTWKHCCNERPKDH